jgi:hypothetical protein
MTDELRNRLERLDPMHPGVPTEPVTTPSSRQRLEDIMSTTTPTTGRGRLYTLAAAAVAAVVVGVFAFGGLGSEPDHPPLTLTLAPEDTLASCIVFSVEELARLPIAFEGTVTGVEGEIVTLSVDQWFKGGDTEEVVLEAPAGMEALIGGLSFTAGDQYLITAVGSSVNYCGFSGPSTPEFRAAFEEAFAS